MIDHLVHTLVILPERQTFRSHLLTYFCSAQEVMLQALLTWTQTTPCEQTDTFQELLHQCFALSTSPDRNIRVAFAHEAQAFAQPALLKAKYGSHASGSSQPSNVSAYEAKLLQVKSALLRFAGHISSVVHRWCVQSQVATSTFYLLAVCELDLYSWWWNTSL